MPLFACRQCNCVENTATGFYWGQDIPLCSECGDDKQWHGRFPKRPATGMLIDQNGNLHSEGEKLPDHYQIIGAVLA